MNAQDRSTEAKTFLLVEDDEGLGELLQEVLQAEGFRVENVRTGKMGLDRLAQSPPDLVLLDYSLPDMTGIEFVETAFRRQEMPPFIVVTGMGDERLAVNVMKLGARDYLVKDSGLFEQLPRTVHRVLDQVDTERRLADAQKALLESEERYRTLFETMAGGVVLIAPDGQIVEANPSAERILGLTRSEITGRTYDSPAWGMLRPDGTPMPPEEMAGPRAMRENRLVKGIVMGFSRSKGSVSWISVSASPLLDEAGELKGVVGTFDDITELWQAEKQLRQAQKAAALGILTGGVAHHFNNLLTSILGFAGLALRDESTGQQAKEHLFQVIETGRRAARLVSQLTAFNRQSILAMKPVDLSGLIAEAAETTRKTAPGDVAIRFQGPGDEAMTLGDRGQLLRMILGLCDNGVRAMPDGGELLLRLERTTLDPDSCRLRAHLTPGEYFCISVRDTGVGIPEEVQRHLFEPFFTTRDVGEGTGLSLAMAYGLVRQHGGHITFSSAVEKGSEFQVFLPDQWHLAGP